jgi:hypothetical protein
VVPAAQPTCSGYLLCGHTSLQRFPSSVFGPLVVLNRVKAPYSCHLENQRQDYQVLAVRQEIPPTVTIVRMTGYE